MTFQIHALPAEDFAALFDLPDSALGMHRARRMIVTENPGTPCRVTLADAEVGETVILVNHTHLPANTPYHASHAIFVRKGKAQVRLPPNEVPGAFITRQISLRALDKNGMMLKGLSLDGSRIGKSLDHLFRDPATAEVHIHFAGPGCFAARATRA